MHNDTPFIQIKTEQPSIEWQSSLRKFKTNTHCIAKCQQRNLNVENKNIREKIHCLQKTVPQK